MFEKRCNACGNKVSRRFGYCPFCGSRLKAKKEVGRKGFLDEDLDSDFGFGFGGMGMPFQGIMNNLMKELDKQLKEVDRGMPNENERRKQFKEFQKPAFAQGISISISSGTSGEPVIKIGNFGKGAGEGQMIKKMPRETKEKKILAPVLTKKEAEKISKLPQTEPQTSVRRLADRIVYEIDLPGVKKENVMIHKLHNSIEIKAFTENKAFFKLIPVALPLLRYYMENGKLVLELKPEM